MFRKNCINTIYNPVIMSLTWRGWLKDGARLISNERLRVVRVFGVWAQRARTRHHLSMLDADGLNDIGLTHEQMCREAQKPFWKA